MINVQSFDAILTPTGDGIPPSKQVPRLENRLKGYCADALLAVRAAKELGTGEKPVVASVRFDKATASRVVGVASGAAFAASKSRVVQQVVESKGRLGGYYKPIMHELMICRDASSLDSFEKKYHDQLKADDASLDSRATGGKRAGR